MTFFNDLRNDSGLVPFLDSLMQVQKPTEMPKVSCENQLFPWLSFLNILLATAMLGHSLHQMCRPLRSHMYCYRIEDNRKDVVLTLNRHWIYDTVSINWNRVQVMEEDEPISCPISVPILMKHKVKTRNILSQDYEIQYSIKQGTNWLNMTKNYRSTRKGFVKKDLCKH